MLTIGIARRGVALWALLVLIALGGCAGRGTDRVEPTPDPAESGTSVEGAAIPHMEPHPVPVGAEPKAAATTSLTPAAERARVSLDSDFDSAAVGSLVELRVEIEDASDVGSVPFHLVYDSSVLEYMTAREGDFLAKDGQAVTFMTAPTEDGNRVVVGLSRLGPVGGVEGRGVLCVLTFLAIGEGHADFRFERAEVIGSGREVRPATFETFAFRVR